MLNFLLQSTTNVIATKLVRSRLAPQLDSIASGFVSSFDDDKRALDADSVNDGSFDDLIIKYINERVDVPFLTEDEEGEVIAMLLETVKFVIMSKLP